MSRDSIESAIAWRAANVKSGPGPEAETDEEVAAIAVKMRQAELADKLESARTRKLKNDILEERLIEKKEVERDIAIAISRMTNKLNALGTRCANLCPSELKPAIKEAVENTTRVILKEMIDDLQERTPDE
ncbi:MAG: hypothetical protein GY903_20830 [Fuerstiella sp.]|nr:hypothetical protein [Fuerstiella sp.]MCP4856935.1 hypothetical protein [Fuerstiella sp.]